MEMIEKNRFQLEGLKCKKGLADLKDFFLCTKRLSA